MPIPEPAANRRQEPSLTPAAPAAAEDFDCWNKIGVNGDNTCKELAAVVHCRNCPVYSAAGMLLLDRQQPADYQKYWTEYFAREKKQATPGRLSAVIFRLGQELLALSTRAFQEVTEPRPIHSLPHRRSGIVLGLTNVRGELLVCVSLSRLLGMERAAPPAITRTRGNRLAVVEWQGQMVTFPVDEVHGVHRFHPEDVQAAPATVARANPGLTQGILPWKERKAGLLDEESLFATFNRSLA